MSQTIPPSRCMPGSSDLFFSCQTCLVPALVSGEIGYIGIMVYLEVDQLFEGARGRSHVP